MAEIHFDPKAPSILVPTVLSGPRVEMITASRVERAPLIVLDRVVVAGGAIGHVEALVHDLPPQGMAEGLLELSFLRYFKLSMDFERGLLTLARIS